MKDLNEMIRKKPWPQWPIYNEKDKDAVIQVIESNQLFAAEKVKQFEEDYAKYVGSKYALGLGNATHGLHLSLAALNVGINDEIIVSPYTWISSASCALMQNAVPIFADIDPETLALSADSIRGAITKRTKAVILVHMNGYPAKMDEILDVVKEHELALIEDASHTHGAKYKGRMVGTFGDIGVFSLHQRKTLSVGDGGIIITDDGEIAEIIYKMRSFGREELSYNYRMTEFAAALGSSRLQNVDKENFIRRENVEYLHGLINHIAGVKVRRAIPESEGVYYMLLIEIEPEAINVTLESFIQKMNTEGIPVKNTMQLLHKHPHFNPTRTPARGIPWKWPLYQSDQFQGKMYKDLSFPIAEEYCEQKLVELTVHPPVGKIEMEDAAKAIEKIIENS